MEKLDYILYQAKSYKNKNWLFSKHILENALKDFPNEKVLYTELGDIFTSKKMFKKAIEYYLNGLKVGKNKDDGILFKIATNFLSINEFALAIEYYEQIKDKNSEVLYNIAYSYSRLNKDDKSLEILKELIKKDNITEIPYLLTAEIYYARKQFKKSLEILKVAEKKFGGSSAIYYLRASAYSQQEFWLQAVTFYKKSEKLNPTFPHFYRNYGYALYHFGKVKEAIEYFKKNIEKEPTDSSTYFYILKALIDIRDYKQAKQYIAMAKKNVNRAESYFIKAFEFQIEKGIIL